MHEIDFLPAEYRQNRAERRWHTRRIVGLGLLAAAILAAALLQRYQQTCLEADLAKCQPAHSEASQTRGNLDRLQARLQAARTRAELLTYLRHPWPRTRILAALLDPLPDEIAFDELRIDRETSPTRRLGESRLPLDRAAEEARRSALPPASRDLKRLRDECDPAQIVVTVTGATTETAVLHRYLGELGKQRLFSKVQLRSIETDEAGRQQTRFSAAIVVRPGYGQPDGPRGPDRRHDVQADPNTT